VRRYQVVLTNTAAEALRKIEKTARGQITNNLRDLQENPSERGAPLRGELAGYRDIRAAGQRYRIIYTVEEHRVIVLVVYLGIRKDGHKSDVYQMAQKLLRAGLIEPKTTGNESDA